LCFLISEIQIKANNIFNQNVRFESVKTNNDLITYVPYKERILNEIYFQTIIPNKIKLTTKYLYLFLEPKIKKTTI